MRVNSSRANDDDATLIEPLAYRMSSGRRSAADLLSKDEARRIARNIAKLLWMPIT